MTGTVGYLTKRFPRLSETFILDEILGLEAAGIPLRLYAIAHPGEEIVQPDVALVKSPVVYLRAPGGWRQAGREVVATLVAHARLLRRAPRRYLGVVAYIAGSRRNLAALRSFAEAGRLALLLEADNARHVHGAFAHGPASIAHFVHLLTGLPFSFGAHAKDIYVSPPELLARKVSDASFVITCSQSAAATMYAIAGPESAKVLLTLHGVDTSRFVPRARAEAAMPGSPSPLRVLAVGRLVAKKGYPVLLEALAALAANGQAVSCTVVGEGSDREKLEAMAARLGVSSMIRFPGARTHQQVAASYLEADVFVQASVVLANGDRDGIPNSLLEAMASGLAVVASDVAGLPEVVGPGCGLLVPPGDQAALAAALERLAVDPALRARLGRAAREHVVSSLDRTVCAKVIAPLFEACPSSLGPIPVTPGSAAMASPPGDGGPVLR